MSQKVDGSSVGFPEYALPRVEVRPLLRNVYLWMTAGLALTAGVSYLIGNSKTALQTLISTPWLYFGLLIGELVLVMVLVAALNKMSAGVATAIFLAYAALNGVTLSLVLMAYSSGTLTLAFTSTAALFAAMSLIGLTTKIDLTKIGTYAIFALVGLILASLINLFLRSSRLDLILSYAGVLIFTALTAYDTQKISRMASDPQMAEEGPVVLRKLSIVGALTLYLDFLNMFLFLLRIFGRR
jgi:FtsH-binding integral membrane protein